MNKTDRYYWFVIFLSCVCNWKKVFSEESVPLHLNFKGKYTSDLKNYEIVVPQRVNKDGSFISHLVSHHHSKRSTKETEFIFYKIPIGGKDYLIELTPNRKLISPGAVVEIHKENARKPGERQFFNETSSNETVGDMFRNLDIRKLENTECHFSGTVKGENISKAALSTCYGLAGFIQITKGFYTIEPVAEHDPFVEDAYPHILYKTDGLENSSVCHTMGQLTGSLVDQLVRKRRESNVGLSLPMYVETLIVMDKTLISHHRDSDCENYVLTVFNMAFNLFHDASSGLMLTLTIVRIIRLEVENDDMNLKVNADAEKTLKYFQTWQYEINPGDDSHPNHHDIAVLITRVNVCYSPSSCGLLGLTTIGKACDPKLSAALCEDNGLRLGYIIAHEIGHLLGADHDSDNSTCNGTDAEGLKTVMHPHVSITAQTWSTCSQDYFKAFFGSGLGSCFLDEPEEHNFNVQDLLPGVMYNSDFQCKLLIAMNARECEIGSTCTSLNCYVPGYACIVTHKQPADGTHCGENMWCRETKCLIVGERPGAIDGNWGDWSAWSDCSRTCGSGVASSVRNCDKPQPSHGGKNCVGERKRYKICAATVISCISNISHLIDFHENLASMDDKTIIIRDIQCGEFNDWIYPEDGKVHTWKAYYFHDDNPCILYCINEEKQVAALRPRVVDGTMCYRGIRDICVAGTCKSLPCDLHFESNAVEDACGVCHGDGTGCDFSEGMETFTKSDKGMIKLVNVPSGTRNIKVEETSPTLAKIIVRDKDTKDIYVRGKSLGMFNVPGSQAWLGMVKKNQEVLNIPGPVSKPLSIWIQRLDNVTIKWSMALPAEQQRKPEFAWDFLTWGPCSAKCGPGTQVSKPSCMEGKAGLVEDSFCADLEMPPTKVRQCEITKCEPRWMVGDWKGCEQPTSQKKERKRIVYCIKPIGEGEGESQIVPDSECTEPKPHNREPCENRQKREDSEYDTENHLDIDSMFKSDTSEFGFHKKYEDYLKHFAALSVPQRNSETIPLYLVSSPHFKHYFHVLETPDDSETDPGSVVDASPNGTSYYAQAETKLSPDFYKETFSGQQIGVSHIQSLHQGGANTIEKRTKKSVNWNSGLVQDDIDSLTDNLKLTKRSKSVPDKKSKGYSNFHSLGRLKTRVGFRKVTKDSLKNTRNAKHKLFLGHESKKNFKYTSPNLTNVIQNLNENEKSRFVTLLNTGRRGELQSLERTKLRSYQMHTLKPKMFFPKRNFFSFFSRNKLKPQDNYDAEKDNTLRRMFKANKEFDGSGLRRLSLTEEKLKENIKESELQKWTKEDKGTCVNPFDPTCTGKFEEHLRKALKEKNPAVKDATSEKRDKRYQRKKDVLKRNEPIGKPSSNRFRKYKRSSRIWKKPKSKDYNAKSGKEPCGSACGTETRNYLNNLFRDTHPKVSNAKPALTRKKPEEKHMLKKPIIREGVLVIDKDLAENQEMEIIFDDDETEEMKKKYVKLPRPAQNERKLTIKGQGVFDLFRELQKRSGRESFYRSHNSQENIEINIKVHGTSEECTTKPETSACETTTTKRETVLTTKLTTTETTKPETTTENIIRTTQPVIATTLVIQAEKTIVTIKKIEGTTCETGTLKQPTKEPTREPTKESTNSKSHDFYDDCEYEVDEIIQEPRPVTDRPIKKKKKKKKKKRKKKKKKKGKKVNKGGRKRTITESPVRSFRIRTNRERQVD